MEMTYFDHNATAPLSPEARAAWLEAAQTQWLNPSSPYRGAAAVRARLEAARERLADLIGASAGRIVFTSGATEANNAILRHWAATLGPDARIGVNPTEHPSVLVPAARLFGDRLVRLPVDESGRIDPAAAEDRVRREGLSAVSVMAANNETGVLQPWAELAERLAAAGCPYHCDASQWIGRMPLKGLGRCAYVTACAHKFGGPKGVGFALLPEGASEVGLFCGGPQEGGRRAGTEDVPGILAMLAALEAAPGVASALEPQRFKARDQFIDGIQGRLPGTEVLGLGAERLWNTVALLPTAFASTRWISALEKRGFRVSSGSACASGSSDQSHVLEAMGVDAVRARRVLRISGGAATKDADWQALEDALVEVSEALGAESDARASTVISID